MGSTVLLVTYFGVIVPEHQAHRVQLSDGTEVFYYGDARIKTDEHFPSPREMTLDGDAFVRVPQGEPPLVVRTRLMVLTLTGGSEVRVTGHANEAGEQVEVLRGQTVVKKSYSSPFAEPDRLAAGEMSMLNQSIDLMEKEKSDSHELRTWRDRLIHRAAATP